MKLTVEDNKVTKLEFVDERQQKPSAPLPKSPRASHSSGISLALSNLSKGEKVALVGAVVVTLGSLYYAGYSWYKRRQEKKQYSEKYR